MTFTRWVALGASVAFMATIAAPHAAHAQGSTTGAITGVVTDASGRPLENAQIQVVNRATGFSTGQLTRGNGRYYVQNLEVGSNYAVTVRLIGFSPVTQAPVRVSLTQATRVDVQLAEQATQLTTVTVQAAGTGSEFSPTRQGVATTVSDTLVRRIPNLDRNFTSLVRLTPQVTSQTGGFSAAGSNPRLTQFNIDGANQSDRFGLNSSDGQPGGATGGRLVPIDAVKEVQVALTPTDVRQGNFAGVLVNAVTRSGTNTFTGGASYTFRNPDLARDTAFVTQGNLRQQQYGFFLGGPIIKDRLHFFTATEWQQRSNPNGGPSFPATAAAGDTVAGGGAVTFGQVQRAQQIAQGLGLNAGDATTLELKNPLVNFIGRLDYRVNEQTRLVFRQLLNRAEQVDFSRNTQNFNPNPNNQGAGIRLTSNQIPRENRNNSSVLQAFTSLPRGISNEFSAAYNTIRDERLPPLQTPEISVAVRRLGSAANAAQGQITFGTEQFSPVNILDQKILELTNNLTVPLNAHTFTFGTRFEYNRILNDFRQRAYGAYKFTSLDSLEARQPAGYSVAYANGPGIAADFRTQMFSAYAQDVWTATPRLTVSGGLRLDVPRLPDSPTYNPNITNGFATRGISGVSTTGTPKTRALWSPRLGINWDVTGRQTFQVRANAGVYTGPPPYLLIGNAYQNTGAGLAFLNCTGAQTPAFTTDVTALPTACQGGTPPQQGSAGTAGVNLTDPNFRFPQRFVTSAGFDRQLPAGFVLSFEGLYGRDINGIRIRDLNLLGPRRTADGTPFATNTGRVIYADTIRTNQTTANTPPTDATNLRAIVRNGQNNVLFEEGAIYLTNQSKAYNYAFTPSLRKRFGRALDLTTSYTYTRAFEVQAFTSDRAISIWRNGREYAGLESADDLTTSTYELRHRVQLYGTLTAPWRRFPTDVSFEYSGNTGAPITYTTNGDLNGDGFAANDPIYIPRNATDPSEIRIGALANGVFTPNANAAASFEHLIQNNACLREQRGQIMERNSCRGPWENLLNVSLRQTLPEVRGQRLTAQLDVFNFLNLLNNEWGVNRRPILSTFSQQQALTVQGRLPGTIANENNVVYSFDNQLVGANNTSRTFQDRVNAIGNVYRMQLTFRYSF